MDRNYISFKTKYGEDVYFINTVDGKFSEHTFVYWRDDSYKKICRSNFKSHEIVECFRSKSWIKTNRKRGFNYA